MQPYLSNPPTLVSVKSIVPGEFVGVIVYVFNRSFRHWLSQSYLGLILFYCLKGIYMINYMPSFCLMGKNSKTITKLCPLCEIQVLFYLLVNSMTLVILFPSFISSACEKLNNVYLPFNLVDIIWSWWLKIHS